MGLLVVSEGLLVYLPDDVVRALGSDLYEQPVFSYWLIDQASPSIAEDVKRDYQRALALAGARMLCPTRPGSNCEVRENVTPGSSLFQPGEIAPYVLGRDIIDSKP